MPEAINQNQLQKDFAFRDRELVVIYEFSSAVHNMMFLEQ
jgi:hypothetical protein